MDSIQYLNKIMNIKTKKELKGNYFSWIYPFTNENIKGYYTNLNLTNKKILCVTASGDHILNAYLCGADKVHAFDSNPLAKYYSELKIASLKSIELSEFINFFNRNKKNTFFDIKVYEKIRDNLNDDIKTFWDYLFNNYSKKDILKSYLFTDDFLPTKALKNSNMYSENNNYNKLRMILNNKKVKYYDIDFKDISNINEYYDYIILSNIASYLDLIFNIKDEKTLLIKLRDILLSLKSKEIVVSYLYSVSMHTNSGIYNRELINEILSDYNYEYIKFNSCESLLYPFISNYYSIKEDKVLLLKK